MNYLMWLLDVVVYSMIFGAFIQAILTLRSMLNNKAAPTTTVTEDETLIAVPAHLGNEAQNILNNVMAARKAKQDALNNTPEC